MEEQKGPFKNVCFVCPKLNLEGVCMVLISAGGGKRGGEREKEGVGIGGWGCFGRAIVRSKR